MSKLDLKEAFTGVFIKQFIQLIFDAWIFMLTMGGIAHNTGIKELSFSYGLSFLVKLASVCLLPQEHTTNALLGKLVEKLK